MISMSNHSLGDSKAIWVPDAWHSGAPYTPAIRQGPFLFVSGMVPVDLRSGKSRGETIEEQTEQVLGNLGEVLEAGGAGFADVAKVTVFLTESSMAARMNTVYARFFSVPYPARSTVQVGPLARPEFLIEVDAIAVAG